MTLLHKLKRRIRINRAVRELSALNQHLLTDIGLDGRNLTAAVEEVFDAKAAATRPDTVVHGKELNHYPVSSGAAA